MPEQGPTPAGNRGREEELADRQVVSSVSSAYGRHDHPSRRAFIWVTPHNEHEAEWMPDDCHDACVKHGVLSVYYPFHWHDGIAWYLCTEGHVWTCGWAVGQTHGDAPRNAGRAIMRYAEDGGPA